MGTTGSVLMKFSLFVMCSTLAIVQLIVFGDVLKGLSLLFCDINVKFLIVGIAIILLPFMFQKDISGVTKIAHFGIIGLSVFCFTKILFKNLSLTIKKNSLKKSFIKVKKEIKNKSPGYEYSMIIDNNVNE